MDSKEILAQLEEASANLNEIMAKPVEPMARAEEIEADCNAAKTRIATLEAELHNASVPLEELIGHNVGLLCVADGVRAISARLKEAEDERDEYLLKADTAEARTAELEAGRKTMFARVTKAEADAARLTKLATEYMEAEKAYRLAHDRGEAGPGLTLRANKADAALRAALVRAEQPDEWQFCARDDKCYLRAGHDGECAKTKERRKSYAEKRADE